MTWLWRCLCEKAPDIFHPGRKICPTIRSKSPVRVTTSSSVPNKHGAFSGEAARFLYPFGSISSTAMRWMREQAEGMFQQTKSDIKSPCVLADDGDGMSNSRENVINCKCPA